MSDDIEEMEITDELGLRIIDTLQDIPGVGKVLATKLYLANYYDIETVAISPIGQLVEKTGMTKTAAEKVIAGARAKAEIGKAVLASDLVESENVRKLTTGSSQFDQLIGGGYPTGAITEIFSVNGAGKTQSCLTATVLATIPESEGGLDGEVIYIDTEGTFRAGRVAQIAEERGLDKMGVLNKIHVIRANNSSHQILLLDEMKKIAKDHKIVLVVVDSVICHLRAEYIGRGTLSERQQLLAKYLSDLHTFAEVNKCVLIITNQMLTSPGVLYGDPNLPTGGNIIGHASMLRINIRKAKDEKRIARLIKSPFLPNGECVFKVTSKGVCD